MLPWTWSYGEIDEEYPRRDIRSLGWRQRENDNNWRTMTLTCNTDSRSAVAEIPGTSRIRTGTARKRPRRYVTDMERYVFGVCIINLLFFHCVAGMRGVLAYAKRANYYRTEWNEGQPSVFDVSRFVHVSKIEFVVAHMQTVDLLPGNMRNCINLFYIPWNFLMFPHWHTHGHWSLFTHLTPWWIRSFIFQKVSFRVVLKKCLFCGKFLDDFQKSC